MMVVVPTPDEIGVIVVRVEESGSLAVTVPMGCSRSDGIHLYTPIAVLLPWLEALHKHVRRDGDHEQ